MTISNISSINSNAKNLSFGNKQENKTSHDNKKKYFTASNVILGSLATIGVLGIADILICKGKFINKLTGVGNQLKKSKKTIECLEVNIEKKEKTIEKLYKKLKESREDWYKLFNENCSLKEQLKNARNQ